jgi:hypothetical protein
MKKNQSECDLADGLEQRVHKEWQLPIMAYLQMKKSSLAGEGGGCKTNPISPFTLFTITCKVAVDVPAERADTLPLFHLYPYMYSEVWSSVKMINVGKNVRLFSETTCS